MSDSQTSDDADGGHYRVGMEPDHKPSVGTDVTKRLPQAFPKLTEGNRAHATGKL